MPNDYLGELKQNESLARFTTWRVGGIANNLYKPANIDDLARYIRQLSQDEMILWLGLGSNLLIRDGGIPGTVILTQGTMNHIQQVEDTVIRAEAGASCAQVARFSARAGLTGLEFLAGVPGTIGGALCMNAGCFGSETWHYIESVETVNRAGEIKIRSPKEYQVSYRQVIAPPNEWFLAAYFKLQKGDKSISLEKIRELLAHRAATQPTGELNCGSVFRNPENDHAGRLIEACQLKGYSIGGAAVSDKHANFIINKGNAKAADIESLIEHVEREVSEKHGVKLMREVRIVGEKE